MTAEIDPFQLYGTRETEIRPQRLIAGRLAVDFKDGNLRTITYDGTEVLRAVAYLVRDRDWGTYAPQLSDLKIDQANDGFSVGYLAHCTGPENTDLAIRVHISAKTAGTVIFEAEATSKTGFETNRCGFCILHPIVGVAGSPVSVEHVDGRREDTRFPDLIEPWQPFKDMRAITHTVMPDVTAECRMEGDTFEMEDQRNWSDASYKTYVRPLALPWPYRIPAGQAVRQRIVLSFADKRKTLTAPASVQPDSRAVTITEGNKRGAMPSIGLVITPEEAKATLDARDVLAEIGPQELLFHFDPNAGHDATAFKTFSTIAGLHAGTSTLEIALPCRKSPLAEVQEIATWMNAAGFKPNAVVISPSVDRQSTPPGSQWPECPPLEEVYAAAQSAFPGLRLGGGMLSYFTELNRKRVPSKPLDFITHCTNPIVHAADDLSIMQTLEALPFITRSVRAIYGDMPYRIGPSTIPMRQNPYGSRTMDNPAGRRIPMANRDPRHNGRFAEAFALGYAAEVLDAGLECLTLSALTGPFGLIAGKDEPSPVGGRRPIFNTVASLARLAGSQWRECISSDPSAVLSFVAAPANGAPQILLVNITATAQPVELGSFRLAEKRESGRLTLQPFAVGSITLMD
ncbi:D-apionate lactonase [Rhizobium sp. BR 362]|uniref:D-apionate lactonase n=1 Tax=Rhizobium sp. BR 362 TaxID=3040670 RepID=UPI002F4126A0